MINVNQPSPDASKKVAACDGSVDRVLSLETMTESEAQRCIEIGKRMPSLHWWYAPNSALAGQSPRQAVDAGKLSEVEALLPRSTP